MSNFIDYIRWRGDLTFAEKGINEVDALIFDEMVYLDMRNIAEGFETGKEITLKDAYNKYVEAGYDQSFQSNDPRELVEAMTASRRFQDIKLKYYIDHTDLDKEVQFAAVTILTDAGEIYVAYRGTDNSIVGWREDFNLSFKTETAGQADAVKYLNTVMEKTDGRIYIGGHSKGGNLAVYAAAFCEEKYRARIEVVYSNDGPGMNRYIAQRGEYQAILGKVKLSIPESSLVGILFSNTEQKKIVKSNAEGGSAQHNPYTWQIVGEHFEEVDSQSTQSVFLNGALNSWLDAMGDDQKEKFTQTIFDTLESSGATTLAQINEDKWLYYNAILKAVFSLDQEQQKVMKDALKELAIISRDALWNEAQKSFEKMKNNS